MLAVRITPSSFLWTKLSHAVCIRRWQQIVIEDVMMPTEVAVKTCLSEFGAVALISSTTTGNAVNPLLREPL